MSQTLRFSFEMSNLETKFDFEASVGNLKTIPKVVSLNKTNWALALGCFFSFLETDVVEILPLHYLCGTEGANFNN